MAEINEQLRSHVTAVGFHLTLGKTHIAALVYVDFKLKQNISGREVLELSHKGIEVPNAPRVPFSQQFATGVNGLINRGLVEHILDQRRKPGEKIVDMRPRRVWRITPAGRLVINLLKEAGLYQEYAVLMPAPGVSA